MQLLRASSDTEAECHALPFVIVATVMTVQFFLKLLIYPETKQRSLEQIQAGFGIGKAMGHWRVDEWMAFGGWQRNRRRAPFVGKYPRFARDVQIVIENEVGRSV